MPLEQLLKLNGALVDVGTGSQVDTSYPLWQYPYAHDSIWNTPAGSGLTLLAKTDQQHIDFVDAGGNLNKGNWSDPLYKAVATDPIYELKWMSSFSSTNYKTLGPFDPYTITGSETWTLLNSHTGVRIPDAAHWYMTTNTDRKVQIVQPACTIDGVDYPDGTCVVEIHCFQRTTTAGVVLCTYSSINDLRYYGLQYGAIASGISPMAGLIRQMEFTRAVAGDVHAISHILRLGLPARKLKVNPQWPARNQDGDTSGYTGLTYYGTMGILDPALNLETATHGGQPLTDAKKALGYTLQDFGGYVLITAGSGPITLQADPQITDDAHIAEMAAVWNDLYIPNMRIATNSIPAGPYAAQYSGVAARMPTDRAQIAGGGTRRRPYRDPVSTTGPWL
jgi:hypothetical protein